MGSDLDPDIDPKSVWQTTFKAYPHAQADERCHRTVRYSGRDVDGDKGFVELMGFVGDVNVVDVYDG